MEREKLQKLKCSFFSTLTYFKGLKTSSHISKIPQSMALIKKEFLTERINGRFLCAYTPTSSCCCIKARAENDFSVQFSQLARIWPLWDKSEQRKIMWNRLLTWWESWPMIPVLPNTTGTFWTPGVPVTIGYYCCILFS